MNKENIEIQLRNWFSQMTKKYSWLRIKFEFNEVRGVFLVSFSPVCQIELSDEFNFDAMNFADEMNATYGNEAPLFTDEETLFRLSAEAEVISSHAFVSFGKPSTTLITVHQQRAYGSWTSAANTTTAPAGKNFRQTQPATYALAA
ncbi:hypothetical protein E5358_12630 [Palleniella muris]|uniref:Uncharacterized protein n=1 Tax=Palleniella muris TaxID=3038145 RepID=A0AC61QML2_9BACT|nr:hypothetical protein [Palleniella muris]TGX80496.1 hypothetical protein E5358_12630 [Palleniella muris]